MADCSDEQGCGVGVAKTRRQKNKGLRREVRRKESEIRTLAGQEVRGSSLPVSQRGPVNPEGQTHVFGDTQVPPLLHPSSQKAENTRFHWSPRYHSSATKKGVCVWGVCEGIKMSKVAPKTAPLNAVKQFKAETHMWQFGCQANDGSHERVSSEKNDE